MATPYLSVKWDSGSQELAQGNMKMTWPKYTKLLDRVQNSYHMPDGLWVDSDIFTYNGKHIKERDEIDVHL